MAATRNGLEPSAWNRGRKGLGKVNNKEIMALSSSSSADSNTILTENDIPGASLNGRNPSSLKNEELKFWLRCRGDSLKGLKTKACFVKRWAYATIYTHGFGGTFTLIIFVFIIGSKNISRLVEIWWWPIRIKIRFIRKERPGFQICRPNAPLKLQPQSIQAMAGENHLKGCRRFRGPKWTSTLKVSHLMHAILMSNSATSLRMISPLKEVMDNISIFTIEDFP